MLLAFALAGVISGTSPDTVPPPAPPVGPRDVPVGIGAPRAADDTTPARRRKAVEISDAYATRLKIHYIASFATIPIFAAQAIVGEQLYHAEQNQNPPSRSLRETHDAIAVTLGALFVTNGITGSMNWWETRHNAAGRPWRTVHAALMLLSEAGFAYTASLGERARFNAPTGTNSARDLHRRWAEISAGTALAAYVMMWKPIRGDH
jgi:hypothetical protein